jgi:hypothetical protein
VTPVRPHADKFFLKQAGKASQQNNRSSNGTQKSISSIPSRAPAASSDTQPPVSISERDRNTLESLVGRHTADQLVQLDNAIQSTNSVGPSSVELPAGLTREQRTDMHQVSLPSLASR